ncbi:DUF2238 domain-containing protein [Novosphingobium panipatense]
MPTGAVLCVCVFLWLHTIGGRYIYSFVPYEDWARALSVPSPQRCWGWSGTHGTGWSISASARA